MASLKQPRPSGAQRMLKTAQWVPLVLIGGYLAVLALFLVPTIQRE